MSDSRFDRQVLKDSGHAVAEDGVVLLEGPDGVSLSLTQEAAQRTGESLIAAAEAVRLQASGGDR